MLSTFFAPGGAISSDGGATVNGVIQRTDVVALIKTGTCIRLLKHVQYFSIANYLLAYIFVSSNSAY